MRKGNPATLPSHLGPEAKLRRRGLVLRSPPRPRGQSKGKRDGGARFQEGRLETARMDLAAELPSPGKQGPGHHGPRTAPCGDSCPASRARPFRISPSPSLPLRSRGRASKPRTEKGYSRVRKAS